MLQSVKVIRLIMMFVFLGILLFSYAYLPLTLDINMDGFDRIGREVYFYSAIGLFLLINLVTYFLRFYAERISMAPYGKLAIHLLAPVLFFSFTLLAGFLTVINNAQDIDPGKWVYLNYLAIVLVSAWTLSFLYAAIRRV